MMQLRYSTRSKTRTGGVYAGRFPAGGTVPVEMRVEMSKLLEYYKILGVTAGAGIADITSSYKRLCRQYHPDLNNDPESEELMKRINVAYAALREKHKREAMFRERVAGNRPAKRYNPQDARGGTDWKHTTERARGGADVHSESSEKRAYAAVVGYFTALCDCDYESAYGYLSEYDKRHIKSGDFVTWRKTVAKLYPMRRFAVGENSDGASVAFKDGKRFNARKYGIKITEYSLFDNDEETGEVTKLVINENGLWRVFLGYKDIGEVTRVFEERLETRRRLELSKSWEEYYKGLCPEYNMLNLTGLRKAALNEIYRQNRYGGSLTFAAISIKPAYGTKEGAAEGLLHAAAHKLTRILRQTDIPAYAGDGIFAVLFVELKKKQAVTIIERVTDELRQSVQELPGGPVTIECEFETHSGVAGIDGFNSVLKKFNKKV